MSKTTFTLKRKLFAGGGFAGSTFGRMLGVNNWSNLGHMATGNVNQAVNLATKKTVNINPATNRAVGSVAGNIAKGIGKPLALAGTLAVGTGLAAKGVVSKASEQSDGSKMFSQVKKNDMATTYTLKRKTYSEEDGKKSRMSTGGKIALGVGATAATTALAFAGARRGLFGGQTAMNANKLWASAGKKLGSQGMVNSAADKYGKAVENITSNRLAGNKKTISDSLQKEINQKATNRGNKAKEAFLNRYNLGGKKPKTSGPNPSQKPEPKSVLDPDNVFKNDGIYGD